MRTTFYNLIYKTISFLFLIVLFFFVFLLSPPSATASTHTPWWDFQSIDTMKYSRDTSRQFLDNPQLAAQVIELQVRLISETGATHVAIATPYDEEFLPILRKWVAVARQYDLNIWYRGNWSGWEQWFGYDSISRAEHIDLTKNFILDNPELFEEGDVFSACPECENGGAGDPRRTGDVDGFRKFLIDEYQITNESFRAIGKNIRANYLPMNGDVAKLIMDEATTLKMGGIVTIDHYVGTPEQLISDIEFISKKSGGKIVLGEFGAPIPDIHGSFTEKQQAEWIDQALGLISVAPEVVGINYWTSFGGSTEIWYSDGTPKQAVPTLKKYFHPQTISGFVKNEKGKLLIGAQVWSLEKKIFTDENGSFTLPFLEKNGNIIISAPGYHEKVIAFDLLSPGQNLEVILESEKVSFVSRFKSFWQKIFDFFL